MSRKDKPFVMYRRGPVDFTIVPRGAKGWIQLSLWLALLLPLIVWFKSHVAAYGEGADFISGVFLFCMGMLAWLICGMWWMVAHAEVLDVSVWNRDKQRARRERERREQAREN
jgi:hypothetical protein